jgi:N-methylhydantoinase A/oxoprolinase/acetone carboxylase beta subunit
VSGYRLGVEVGGTFTDLALYDADSGWVRRRQAAAATAALPQLHVSGSAELRLAPAAPILTARASTKSAAQAQGDHATQRREPDHAAGSLQSLADQPS